MGSLDWILELVLVGVLAFTLVHAIRLERALQLLRKDRTALGEAIESFDSSTRQAEAGIAKLQSAAGESTQMLVQRLTQVTSLRDDLAFLIERGEQVADRLDGLVRSGRTATPQPPQPPQPVAPAAIAQPPAEPAPKVRSQAERDLLLALRGAQ